MGGEREDRAAGESTSARIDVESSRGASSPDLERQLATQIRVNRLARRYLSISADDLDERIRADLPTAAELSGADRVRLIALHPRENTSPIAFYDWCAPGVVADMPEVAMESAEKFRWFAGQLTRGKPIQLASVDDLPAGAVAERQDMATRSIRSILALPVLSENEVIGFQIFECVKNSRSWTQEQLSMLSLIGEVIASAIRRRHAEADLHESEARFGAIAECSTELIAELDSGGRIRYANSSFEHKLGYPSKWFVGKRIQRVMHVDDYESLRGVYAEAMSSEQEVRAVHRLRHQDGSWRWFESSGRARRTSSNRTRFIAVARDITERKAAEETVERQLKLEKRIASISRRFLALQGEEIDDAIRGALVEAAELAGADRSFLKSQELDTDAGRASYEWCADGVQSAVADQKPWSERELAAGQILNFSSIEDLPVGADREKRDLKRRGVQSLLSIPIRLRGRTIGLLGFEAHRQRRCWSDHDVTLLRLIGEILASTLGRKYSDAALRETESKLRHAQKLEAVGRLAGGIAHDFNNLLTVILGFSRPLLRELEEGNPIREDVIEIHGAAERAVALTRQLLTFSRRQAVEECVVDLNAMLSGMASLLARLIGEDVELVMDLDEHLPGVKGDTHQFEQVIINLAANARDAMPDGGTLQIITQTCDLDAPQARRRGLRGADTYVLFSVRDSGHGMDEETRAQIFDPFFTTKEPGRGTGLGLSIAYSVVDGAGGTIRVEGLPSKGTNFDIWLPVVDRAFELESDAEVEPELSGSGCVLVVEDDPSVRQLAVRILEESGYEVIHAADGVEALELARGFDRPIDALVTDVVMPRLGGGKLARRLRADRPNLALLFMSGYPDGRGEGHEGLPSDAAVVQKPFRSAALLAKLREVLDSVRGGESER